MHLLRRHLGIVLVKCANNLTAIDGVSEPWCKKTNAPTTTALDKDVHKAWWIDPQSNRKVEFELKEKHHDVCRPLGMVFGGVEGETLWGAPIVALARSTN